MGLGCRYFHRDTNLFFRGGVEAIVLHRVLEERANIDNLTAQFQLAADNPGDVEKVVDQSRLHLDVATDHG